MKVFLSGLMCFFKVYFGPYFTWYADCFDNNKRSNGHPLIAGGRGRFYGSKIWRIAHKVAMPAPRTASCTWRTKKAPKPRHFEETKAILNQTKPPKLVSRLQLNHAACSHPLGAGRRHLRVYLAALFRSQVDPQRCGSLLGIFFAACL